MSWDKFLRMAIVEIEKYQEGEVFVVWFCKTLQNWKAILGTRAALYEATLDGDKGKIYVDRYEKTRQTIVELSRK